MAQTSEENEWQPVRIAPAENVKFHESKASGHYLWVKHQGKIVRVRPAQYLGIDKCPFGRTFEIHPDDVSIVDANYGDVPVLCEHQILAD